MELCDRVAVLHGGRIRAVGTPAELSSRIAGERYRLWTMCPQHHAFAELAARASVRDIMHGELNEGGWWRVEMTIPGGPRSASEVLGFLAVAGVPVSAFERVQLPLADLIERSVENSMRGAHRE
jgi:ABC-type multidrug transport system ATPase subunit